MADTIETSKYTQLKCKCRECGLHFVVCTWKPESHASTTLYCPECGQHDGKYMLWAEEIEGDIFSLVPGNAEPISLT